MHLLVTDLFLKK